MEHQILVGDALDQLRALPDQSVHCCVTSPPYYGLRDYGIAGQLGLEQTPEEYVANLVDVFREVRRVLRDDGTLWLNIGDSYATGGRAFGGKHVAPGGTASGWHSAPPGLKHKDLIGIPWRLALALQADGWYLRSDIIWTKPNAMPESVTDRPTRAHEYIFLMSKSPRYYYDAESVKEPAVGSKKGKWSSFKRDDSKRGESICPLSPTPTHRQARDEVRYDGELRNRRSVWSVATRSFKGAHFAVFPCELVEPCILAGCPGGGTVLDPFGGSGTVAAVAEKLGRNSIYIDLNPSYAEMAAARLGGGDD